MELKDDLGLAVGFVTVEEALTLPLDESTGPAEVLRVVRPPVSEWDRLRAKGFVPKPARISWIMATRGSDEEYLESLPKKERWSVRRARRLAADDGVHFVVEQPVGAAGFEAFFQIYLAQVEQMRFGVPFATSHQEAILTGADPYLAIWARTGTKMVGGCLVLADPAARFAKIRFSAVSRRFRDTGLSRVVYLEAVRASRERGYDSVSLGSEPNLYGHIVKAGLFSFKRRLGFVPMPSQEVGNAGFDEADKVLRLGALEDPGLILGYPDGSASGSWRGGCGNFYTSAAELDLFPYRTDLMTGVSVTQVPTST
ncbi:MAG: GNAT family N-acetyltransferase [Pseudonocardiaceae bacterium]